MSGIVPILEYHGVGEAPPGVQQPYLYVRPAQFRRQIGLLRMLGIRCVSVSEALRLLDAKAADRIVALTFDDAYRDVFVHALPILRAAGFTATCYAVSDRLNSYNTWDADLLGVRKPTMS